MSFVVLYAVGVGLVVGSYLNVVVHRLPRGISTVRPPSACPACGARIRARDNIPVVGYLILGGRCRACRARISPRYPAVETLTGVAFGYAAFRFGPTLDAVAAALLAALLIALAGIDFDHLYLPDRITLPGIALGLLVAPHLAGGSWARGLAGALLGGGILLSLAGLWKLLRGTDGMGLGDVKMLAMIGAFLGASGVAVTLLVATVVGASAGLLVVAGGRGSSSTELPFGLFLALGGLVAQFAGEGLMRWYLGLW